MRQRIFFLKGGEGLRIIEQYVCVQSPTNFNSLFSHFSTTVHRNTKNGTNYEEPKNR